MVLASFKYAHGHIRVLRQACSNDQPSSSPTNDDIVVIVPEEGFGGSGEGGQMMAIGMAVQPVNIAVRRHDCRTPAFSRKIAIWSRQGV